MDNGLLFVGLVILDPTERVMRWFKGEDLVEHESVEDAGVRRPGLVVVVRSGSEHMAERVVRERVSKEFRGDEILEVALRDISDDEAAVSEEGVVRGNLKDGEAELPAVYVAVSDDSESVEDMLEWAHEFVTGR